MVSVQMRVDEASGRVCWLDVAYVVFLLDRVRMKGTWQVTWFMLSMGGVV